MYPRKMETGSKERDGEGEGKSLAYEHGSVRGERFCVIINRIVSTCTGNVHRMIMKKHLFDVQVEQIKKYLFKKTGLFQFTNFLERSIKIGPFLERGISFRANSRTGYKKLAHF